MDPLAAAVKNEDHVALQESLFRIVEKHDRGESIAEERGILELLYRDGTDRQRRCLVNGLLEHLFEVPGISDSFGYWKEDDILGQAFAQAQAWAAYVTSKRRLLMKISDPIAQAFRNRGKSANVRAPEIGTDTVIIELAGSRDHTTNLVLDASPSVLLMLDSMNEGNSAWLSGLVAQAVDPPNWKSDDYDPFTKWLTLQAVPVRS